LSRAVKEWIGKTDDTRPPPRVQLRILERHEFRCYLTGVEIRDGDRPHIEFDHVVALVNGGENRETNLAPAFRKAHREKTKRDVAEKSKVRKKQAKAFVKERPKHRWPKRAFPKRANPWA